MSWVRQAAVAGTFYPGSKVALTAEVSRCLGSHLGDERARVVAAPHAGYQYSGAIAGELYARIRVPKRCIVLSPNHTGLGVPFSLWPRGVWRTPLGDVPVDESLASKLSEAYPRLQEDAAAHVREHALEVHLPFLQTRQADVQIVPLTLGHLRYQDCEELGHAIAGVIENTADEILLIASTDMSHYLSATDAKRQDEKALAQVLSVDGRGLYETVEKYDISMCGFIPTTVALCAAERLGARHATLLRYGNSGETSGDFSRVVGYASVTIT